MNIDRDERLSMRQKEANNFEWYKKKADNLQAQRSSSDLI
jgi:hypothetical protein